MAGTVEQLVRRGFTTGQAAALEEIFPEISRNTSGGATGLAWGDGVNPLAKHPYYHFHGCGANQYLGDSKFLDMSGINHGIRGANLSDAAMFATAGYVTTVNPATSLTDSVIRIPAINFDYSAGETLIVWMLGKWTPEASAEIMIGDGYSTTAGQRGWAIRVTTTGKVQPVLYGATSGFGGSSAATVFDGALHSFGVVLAGGPKKYCLWADGEVDTNFGSDYATFNSGTDHDTRSINTINIGAGSPSPGGLSGIACVVRACAILRLPASRPLPSVADFTEAFQQLRASPDRLILAGAF